MTTAEGLCEFCDHPEHPGTCTKASVWGDAEFSRTPGTYAGPCVCEARTTSQVRLRHPNRAKARHFPQPSDVRPAEHPGSWTDVRYFPEAERLFQEMVLRPGWDWASVMAGVRCTDHGRAWPATFTPIR